MALRRKESTNKAAAWENAPRLQNIRELKKNGQLNIAVVVQLLWSLKDDAEIVENLSDLLTSDGSSKGVFDGIEFYLPQLVHMMIHLDDSWKYPVIEQFLYMVAQQSIHLALQVHWLLAGYAREYRPEATVGRHNAQANDYLFKKVARITTNLEIVVTYGNPDITDLEKQYHDKKLSKEEFIEQKKGNNYLFASRLTENVDEKPIISQMLKHKIKYNDRNEIVGGKWKEFLVDFKDHMLFMSDPTKKDPDTLVRSINLKNATVTHLPVDKESKQKHEHLIEIKEEGKDNVSYMFRASNKTRRIKWMRLLSEAANEPPKYSHGEEDTNISDKQNSRFSFYRSQLKFVAELTNICDYLNDLKEDEFKQIALNNSMKNLEIDEMNYNPLCRSSDPFVQVVASIPSQSHAFTTKGHSPAILAFKTSKVHNELDVANFLNDQFSEDAVAGILDSLSHMLAPVASLIVGDKGATNMLVKRPSLWEEDEDDIISLSRTNLPVRENELLLIAKSDETIRMEAFAMQLIWFIKDKWDADAPELYLYPFHIMATSNQTGLIEYVPSCKSLDGLKKDYKRQEKRNVTLKEHFTKQFGQDLKAAQIRFVESLAAYSVISYVLGIKNRNNSNIMLSEEGRIIHVDFGHILGLAPGKVFNTEKAAFKLTNEMLEVMDGEGSDLYQEFVAMCIKGFQVIRSNFEMLIDLVSITAHNSSMPCFTQGGGPEKVIKDLQKRLMITVSTEVASINFTKMISKSKNHVGTKMFDKYESVSRNISVMK
mmetsp:Transcript_6766/g.7772  ORF Transcript_6766/g.7772 Transcript_6766/m.7772 type:complete len:767 (-) Transcript_6766:527-2827(-)